MKIFLYSILIFSVCLVVYTIAKNVNLYLLCNAVFDDGMTVTEYIKTFLLA